MGSSSSQCYMEEEEEVVVVGGGPAGCHMAVLLAQLGLKKVTLLEAEEMVGGKSLSLENPHGTVHEMGACYLHKLYGPVRELLAKYDPDNQELPLGGGGVRKVFGADLKGSSTENFCRGKEFGDWVVARAEEAAKVPSHCFGCCCPDFLLCGRTKSAMATYRRLHITQFGEYHLYGVPPKPKYWRRLDMTAFEWLEKNELLELEGIIRYVQQATGYGVLEDMPALYMLWFTHPDLLSGVVEQVIAGDSGLTMLSKGYQSLWRNMVIAQQEKSGSKFNVVTGAVVSKVDRHMSRMSSKKPEVTYVKNDAVVKISCSKIVMALDMSRCKHLVHDLTSKETDVFSGYAPGVLATTLYEANPMDKEHALELWLGRMRPSEERDGFGVEGRMYAHRNSRLALNPTDSTPPAREQRVAYQYLKRPLKTDDPDALQKQLLKDLDQVGEGDVKVLLQKPWPHMPIFTQGALQDLNVWNILAMQGKNDTFWIGSSVCFDSVLDVVAYNNKLFEAMREKGVGPPKGGGLAGPPAAELEPYVETRLPVV